MRPRRRCSPGMTIACRATNGVDAGKAVNIQCKPLGQLIIIVIVDILKALSNSFFDQVACLPCGGRISRGSLGPILSPTHPLGPVRAPQSADERSYEFSGGDE
jgi:hypothetical protein